MKKNSKVIVLERNQFAMLVKTHRKSLLIINVLTYICQAKKVRLIMTLEEAWSRHRGAKPLRRCELLGVISLLSPG